MDTAAADALPEAERAAAKQRFVDQCAQEIIADYAARGEKVLSIPWRADRHWLSRLRAGHSGDHASDGAAAHQRQISGGGLRFHRHFLPGCGQAPRYYHAPFEVIGIPIEPDYRPVEETVDFINELSHTFEMGFTCTAQDLHLEFGPAETPYGGVGYNEAGQRYGALH